MRGSEKLDLPDKIIWNKSIWERTPTLISKINDQGNLDFNLLGEINYLTVLSGNGISV